MITTIMAIVSLIMLAFSAVFAFISAISIIAMLFDGSYNVSQERNMLATVVIAAGLAFTAIYIINW